jgi:hypothetical protein
MGIKISSGFDLNTGRPIDSRTVKADLTARDAIVATLRYHGLKVYVTAEQKEYQLVGGITNSNWIEVLGTSPADGVWKWNVDKYEPYTTAATGVFDTSATTPTGSTRLNWGGIFRAAQLYEGATRVSVAGHNHTGVYEPVLGNPDITGKVLSSTTGGVRSWVTPSSTITGGALTKVDDTNVTLTLGGFPSTALLIATSITVGWTGTLADSRIASAATWNAKADVGSVITIAGTPQHDEVAVWDSATALRANPLITFDGTTLNVTGNITATGEISAFSSGAPTNWWDSMPWATTTTIGGIIYNEDQFERIGDIFSIKSGVLVPASHSHIWADITSGVPGYLLPDSATAANQIAIWATSSTLKGLAGLTYNGTDLIVSGNIQATGEVTAFSSGVSILGTSFPTFANPLICDASISKNFVCGTITGNTTINLTNYSDGERGLIVITMDGTGGYTIDLGTMFNSTVNHAVTAVTLVTTPLASTVIEYWVLDTDVYYRINTLDLVPTPTTTLSPTTTGSVTTTATPNTTTLPPTTIGFTTTLLGTTP